MHETLNIARLFHSLRDFLLSGGISSYDKTWNLGNTFLSAWLMNCLAWSTSFLTSSKEEEEEEEAKTAVVETADGIRWRRGLFEQLDVEEEEGRMGVEEEKEVVVRVEEVIIGLFNLCLRPSWICCAIEWSPKNYPLVSAAVQSVRADKEVWPLSLKSVKNSWRPLQKPSTCHFYFWWTLPISGFFRLPRLTSLAWLLLRYILLL